jgi:magnesium transporter
MTMTGVSQLESDAPTTTPITFILKGETLVTIRYAQPKPFFTYATRARKAGASSIRPRMMSGASMPENRSP